MTKRLVPLFLLFVAITSTGTIHAQDNKDPWKILLAYEKDEKPKSYQRIALRPNVTQAVFVHLQNAGPAAKKNLAVTLVRIGDQDKVEVLGQGIVDKIAAGQTQVLAFKPPTPPKDAPKDLPPPGEYAPPFRFQVWLFDGKKGPTKLDLPLIIQHPTEYVTATAKFDRVKNRLSVEVEPDAATPRPNPPCIVELVLQPQSLPGLIPPKLGTFQGMLSAANPRLELFASGLEFSQGVPPKDGRVLLTVDGYERGFLFKASFDGGNLFRLPALNRVRVIAPRYFVPKEAAPDPKADPKEQKGPPKLPLKLEVDGDLDQDARVEVALDRVGSGNFIPQIILPSLRAQTLSIAFAENALLCKTSVKDWSLSLDTTGLAGKRQLRLRLLNPAGAPLPLAGDEQTLALYSSDPVQNPYAPLSFDAVEKAVYADIVVDATAPEGLRVDVLPPAASPGAKVRIKATAKPRDPKSQADISKVRFVVGDPQKDPPIEAAFDSTLKAWTADAVVPSDAKDKVLVSAQFLTAAGIPANTSAYLLILKDGAGGGDTATRITGKVSWNSFAQPKIDVQLKDAKGADVKKVQTNDKGIYLFDNVMPGEYSLIASKLAFKGMGKVTAVKGQTVTENIELKRK